MIAPAVTGKDKPMIWEIPISARPTVPAVVQELPMDMATSAHMIRVAG